MKSQSNRAEFFSENRRTGIVALKRTALRRLTELPNWRISLSDCGARKALSSQCSPCLTCVRDSTGSGIKVEHGKCCRCQTASGRSDPESYRPVPLLPLVLSSRSSLGSLFPKVLHRNECPGNSSAPRNCRRFGVFRKALCATRRCAEIGPTYVKLGGRIKYDLADVERYVRANKRMPSVRAHGG